MLLKAFDKIEKSAAPASAAVSLPVGGLNLGTRESMSVGAVYGCVNLISDSMGKLPEHVINLQTRQPMEGHPLTQLLAVRPNEMQTPFDRKKYLAASMLLTGNAYEWILRDPRSLRPVELLPLPPELVYCWRDKRGHVWYDVTNPVNGELMRLPSSEVVHSRCFSYDGLNGVSVLKHAAVTIRTACAAQEYSAGYYERGGQPSGVLEADGDLSSNVTYKDKEGKEVTEPKREVLRREWEKVHSGPSNSHRVAILDHGLKYTALQMSQSDAQFIETMGATVEDICRFFNVPLYKMQAGKQSYSSNEQNAIEYVTGCLHPKVQQAEEERSYKYLSGGELADGLWIRINMMAELRGDTTARAEWYRTMRDIGVYSVNDICALEDRPDVPGGNTRQASLNFVPLEDWERQTANRNGGSSNEG